MHTYLCVDESGTFNSSYERYYIISAIITNDVEKLQNLHRQIEPLVRKNKGTKELKASSLKDEKKALFINGVVEEGYTICSLAIDKNKLLQFYKYNISEFFIYNFALKELVKYIISLKLLDDISELLILVDKRSMNHKVYLELESYLNLEFYNRFRRLKVIYKDSATNREIQMADYISNMFYGKLNNSNDTHKLIKNIKRINLETFPK